MYKKGKRNKFRVSKKQKLLLSSMAAVGLISAAGAVIDQDKVQASELYIWEKYKINKVYDNKQDAPIVGYAVTVAYEWNGEMWDNVTFYDVNWNVKQRSELGDTNLGHLYSLIWDNERVDTSVPGEKSYRLTEKLRYYEYERTLVDTVKASINAYPENTVHSDGFFYVKKGLANTAPTTPTLTVPQKQFEYGDRHIIGWNSVDAENDPITYTLQASYNGGAWETVYTGPNRSFEYVVPNNKGVNVKFQVIASDGKLTTTSSESQAKSIREVIYYWNKFTSLENILAVAESQGVNESNSCHKCNWQNPAPYYKYDDIYYFYINYYAFENPYIYPEFQYGTDMSFDDQGNLVLTGVIPNNTNYLPYGYTFYINYGTDQWGQNQGLKKYEVISHDDRNIRLKVETFKIIKTNNGYKKGALLEQNIQAGLNAYPHDQRNSADGNWYVRGQRVLDEDTTPPIIELTEQQNYGATSSISVRTHDLGTVQTVKWAQGNRNTAYFASTGTVIATGQNAVSSFVAPSNGVYTVYAVDNRGNATVQTIEVKKVNTPPTMLSVEAVNKFDVIDASTNFQIRAMAEDVDPQKLHLTATYNGKTATAANGLNLEILGANYSKGFYTSPITVTANDGIANSTPITLNDHVVIRVEDAVDYKTDLSRHTKNPDVFTINQHRSFYNAYEAVLTYERGKTLAQYTSAKEAITAMAEGTGIMDSATLAEWYERVDVVFTDEALKIAERSLDKKDYDLAFDLHSKLKLQSNKELLQERLNDLGHYHVANEAIYTMSAEIANARSEARSINKNIVSWDKINEAQNLINNVKNVTNKNILNDRLKKVIKDFLSIKGEITNEDLEGIGAEDVKEELEGLYDEYKDAFQPIDENAQNLVNFVNSLQDTLANLSQEKVDSFHQIVAGLPVNIQGHLTSVVVAVDELLTYRQQFLLSTEANNELYNTVDVVNYTLTKNYMIEMIQAMKEVIEYNELHTDKEKIEGQDELKDLWEGKLKVDLQEYLDNGIPEIFINGDVYSYINDGTLIIKGTITDTNHNSHEITATLGSDKKVLNTVNGTFEFVFSNLPDGLNTNEINLVANDGLTKKRIEITGKPIVAVSNISLFTQFVQALEMDKEQRFNEMEQSLIVDLHSLFNKVTAVTVTTGDRTIRDIENEAEFLSGQTEGQLETLVKNYINNMRLEWLINNYKNATTEDFAWAGVKGVTESNIQALKALIDDYVASFNNQNIETPSLNDYHYWLQVLVHVSDITNKINAAKQLTNTNQLATAINQLQTLVNDLPEWLSQKIEFENEIENLSTLHAAVAAVEEAENSFAKVDYDKAQILVDALPASAAKVSLTERLQFIIDVINATELVEIAENTKDDADIALAQTAVQALKDSPKKTELEDRLNALSSLVNAIQLVEKAEQTEDQVDVDEAKSFINTLPITPATEALVNRLNEVQKVINARTAVEKAEQTLNVDDIAAAQNLINAIDDSKSSKDILQNRLNQLNTLYDTIQSVISAEKSEEQASKDSAQVKVDLLPDSEIKDRLNNRLNEVQKVIDAKIAVEKAEMTRDLQDIELAQELVNAISNEKSTKEVLQQRLDALNSLLEAIKAVEKAEQTLKQTDKDAAEELVNNLPDSSDKQELMDRLDKLQEEINKKSAEEKASDAVEKAEESWQQEDFNEAQDLVNELEDGPVKNELQDRLDQLQENLQSYEKARAAVEKAETSKLQNDVDSAQALVDALPDNTHKEQLQTRLDEVSKYIQAEKAVSKAEETLIQKHKDEAQKLVDALQPSVDKEELQNRLDAIQKAIDEKTELDLLDRILAGENVTAQELADYTNEIVYEELLGAYHDDIRAAGDVAKITKDDAIQIIKLLNALELAKLSMLEVDIQLYDELLARSTFPTKNQYPVPTVMFATAEYLINDNESTKETLAVALAQLLGKSKSDILDEMESYIKNVEANGIYVVEYITEEGQIILKQQHTTSFGLVEVVGKAPEGYTLIDKPVKQFELMKENNGHSISFLVKSTEKVTTDDSAEVSLTGGYNVIYQTTEGEVIHEVNKTEIPLGELTIMANLSIKELEGYVLVNEQETEKTITLTKENPFENIIFELSKLGDNDGETTTSDSVEIEQTISDTVGTETALVRSLLIASLNDIKFSSAPFISNQKVSHEQYMYQASQALMMIKGYLINPTEEKYQSTKDFIVNTLYDGVYKSELLKLIGVNIEDIGNGDDGDPDLTPTYPKPIEPTNPTDPGDGDGGTTNPGNGDNKEEIEKPIPPVTIEPKPPVEIEPPEEGSTEADIEKIKGPEDLGDGGFKWVIEHPAEKEYTLKAKDITIQLTLDKKMDVDKLEIIWRHLGDEHYSLQIFADGIELKAFKAKIALSKTKKFAYMLRQVDNTYKAMPYNYENGKFNFTISKTGVFFFSKEKRTFTDISKFVDTKDAIEELASRHIVYGTSSTKYSPNANITRAQLSAMIARALNLEATIENPFSDTKGKWYEADVTALYEAGIISGISPSKFNPEAYVTRQQAAQMLDKVIRHADKQPSIANLGNVPKLTVVFKDQAAISNDANQAVARLYNLGVIHGKEDGRFDPKGHLTRSQMAKMLTGVLKHTGDM